MSNVASFPAAHAALISTAPVVQAAANHDRVAINAVLARPEIKAGLFRRGVRVDEAIQRVAALTDDEVRTLYRGNSIRFPPAGSTFLGLF
jgi:hypothetical protein